MRALRWYFVLAFVISWSGVLLAASQHQLYLLFVAMLIGPSLSSIVLTAYYERARGLRELAQRLVRWRFGSRWYASLFVAPVTLGLVAAVLSLYSPSFHPGFAVPFALIAGFGAGIFEELGWTGFATPRLLRRYSWFDAGLLLGVPWAIWHLLTDYIGRDVHGWLWIPHALQWIVALCAFRIFMTWIYSHTRSLLLGILLHVSFTGSQALLWPVKPTLPVELIWYGLFAIALWIPVAVLVAKSFASIGASGREKTRAMPGDRIIADPMFTVTHAITIDAPAERIWPWLAQLGSSRAGWYSYDRIDNGGQPSADRIVSAYQRVRRGDLMPALPGATDAFIVERIEAPHDLVLTVPGDPAPILSWEHLVEPLDAGRSRLIVRGRVSRAWKRMARGAGQAGEKKVFIEYVYRVLGRLPDMLLAFIGGVGHRWMEARHMRGIKERVEASVG